MSVTKRCGCSRYYYRVLHRNHNHSYFESPKGGPHYSDYSGIICLRCGWHFRTKAKWVLETPDVTESQLDDLVRRNPTPNVGYERVSTAKAGEEAEFHVTVTKIKEWEQATVRIESGADYHYIWWMCACEYFLHKTAQARSRIYGDSYEDSLASLVKGAKTYSDKIVKLRR